MSYTRVVSYRIVSHRIVSSILTISHPSRSPPVYRHRFHRAAYHGLDFSLFPRNHLTTSPKPHLASPRPSTAPTQTTTSKNTRSTQLLEIHLAVTKVVRTHVSTRCPRARERPHGRKNRSVMYAPSLAYFLPPSTRMKRTTRNETPGKIAGLEKKLAVVFGRTGGMLRGEGI